LALCSKEDPIPSPPPSARVSGRNPIYLLYQLLQLIRIHTYCIPTYCPALFLCTPATYGGRGAAKNLSKARPLYHWHQWRGATNAAAALYSAKSRYVRPRSCHSYLPRCPWVVHVCSMHKPCERKKIYISGDIHILLESPWFYRGSTKATKYDAEQPFLSRWENDAAGQWNCQGTHYHLYHILTVSSLTPRLKIYNTIQ
jgi:hypothetical protein